VRALRHHSAGSMSWSSSAAVTTPTVWWTGSGTLLYVEPIFLQARDAAYPELRVVVLMHGDRMSYASTFADALAGLVAGAPDRLLGAAVPGEPRPGEDAARRANEAFEGYLRALGEKRFEDAARALEALQHALRRLGETVGEGGID
jgi:uncharacterized membrane protein (UPF0182 family)